MIARHPLLLLALLLPGMARAESWRLLEKKDAFTDEVRREVCALDDGRNEVCFWFARDRGGFQGLWISFALAEAETRSLDHKRIPWLRVDDRKAFDWSIISLEDTVREQVIPRRVEPRWIMWRASVQTAPGDTGIARNQLGVLWQVGHGKTLKIRAFLTGGIQKDSAVNLAELAPLLRRISPMKLD